MLDTFYNLNFKHLRSSFRIQESPNRNVKRMQQNLLQHWIDSFYGYGSWSAPHWYISYEEDGGDTPEEVAEKIEFFGKRQSVGDDLVDIRELYKVCTIPWDSNRLASLETLFDLRFGQQANSSTVWRNLSAFGHAWENEKFTDELEYQRHQFARKDRGREAWLKLYPLPAHSHAWYYAWLELPDLPFLKTRVTYEDHLFRTRLTKFVEGIRQYRPRLVLMYGMNNIQAIRQFIIASFPGTRFGSVKSTKLKIPSHHYTTIGNTMLVVTTQIPALRHQRVETGFDWAAFGSQLRVATRH